MKRICACGCGQRFEPDKFNPKQRFHNKKCRLRAWRRKHREELAARARRYYQEHKEQEAARNRRWREQNPEKVRNRMRRFREKNPEYERRWRENNLERARAHCRRWRKANLEKDALRAACRRARKRLLPATLTAEQAERLLAIGRATYPGEDLHLDHVVPLNEGGGTTMANIHAIPANLNCSKSNKLPQEVYGQLLLSPHKTREEEEDESALWRASSG